MSEYNDQPMEEAHALAERLRALIEAVRVSYEQVAKAITKPIEESLRLTQQVVDAALKELPPKAKEALIILGEHGWYLDLAFSLPELTSLAGLFIRGNIEGAECILIDHYRMRLPEIADEIASKHPERTKVLMPAFDAHHRGEYVLSIPVFLAQADGICKERFGGISLYSRQRGNRRPVTAKAIEDRQLDSDPIEAAMLHPLKIPLPISASKDELLGLLNVLNRHEILHGTSVDYGTELNSLKAISLLYYVVSVLTKPVDANLTRAKS